jgi:hypothetical protein
VAQGKAAASSVIVVLSKMRQGVRALEGK